MRARDFLGEAPERIDPSSFGLEDDKINHDFVASQLPKVKETIRQNDEYALVRTGDNEHGWFILYDKKAELADYAVQYAARNWSWLPRTVTQCILWRSITGTSNRGITTEVFFDILLPNYGAIMSDRQQTDSGHNFWIARMADAVAKNKKVGLADLHKRTVIWYDGDSRGIKNWIKSQESFDKGMKFQSLRYMITDQAPEAKPLSGNGPSDGAEPAQKPA